MYERFNTYSTTRPRLRKIVGWTLVVVGFVALIIPIIPGAPIVFIGFEILGLRFIFTDKIKAFIWRQRTPSKSLVSLENA
jgi:hypothetical protein